jgi:hypothetical protein
MGDRCCSTVAKYPHPYNNEDDAMQGMHLVEGGVGEASQILADSSSRNLHEQVLQAFDEPREGQRAAVELIRSPKAPCSIVNSYLIILM